VENPARVGGEGSGRIGDAADASDGGCAGTSNPSTKQHTPQLSHSRQILVADVAPPTCARRPAQLLLNPAHGTPPRPTAPMKNRPPHLAKSSPLRDSALGIPFKAARARQRRDEEGRSLMEVYAYPNRP
jgi:hypothetical protein